MLPDCLTISPLLKHLKDRYPSPTTQVLINSYTNKDVSGQDQALQNVIKAIGKIDFNKMAKHKLFCNLDLVEPEDENPVQDELSVRHALAKRYTVNFNGLRDMTDHSFMSRVKTQMQQRGAETESTVSFLKVKTDLDIGRTHYFNLYVIGCYQ